MSIPKEPRQIMINLMYLVLTALLALNVSNEILNAFKTLRTSIDKSNISIDANTNQVYTAIKESEKEPGQAEKVRPYREKADIIVKKADEMIAYFNNWKKRIVMDAGGYSKEDTTMPDKMDNIDATTRLLVELKGGDTLRKKITEMRQFLLEMIPSDSAQLSGLMPLAVVPAHKSEHNPTGDWNIENFEHMPAVAALALFSKFQNDVRSSENLVIKRLAELAHTKDIKFDTMAAVAVPRTTYALQGDKIEATILLAAFNKTNKPTVSINQGGGTKKDAINGVVPWETVASGVGMQTVKGIVQLETSQGLIKKEWSFDYMVGTTNASLQLDKMNVFYIGVDNPVTVSAAGYAVEDVYLELPAGATQTGENGHYAIRCSQPSTDFNVKIMAKGKVKDGAPINVATQKMRVKFIPNPVAYVLDKNTGYMPAAKFKVAVGPIAKLDNFDFDAKFIVSECKFSILPKGGDYVPPITIVKKSALGVKFSDNPDVPRIIDRVKPGDKIFIEDIKGVGPDGKTRSLNSIILTLN